MVYARSADGARAMAWRSLASPVPPKLHSVYRVFKCNHILISLYKLKSEAEIGLQISVDSTPISKARYLLVLPAVI